MMSALAETPSYDHAAFEETPSDNGDAFIEHAAEKQRSSKNDCLLGYCAIRMNIS